MNPYWIIVALSALVQCIAFLRWLHRRERDDEMRRAFMHDLALIHLPYVHHALRQMGERLGVALPDPPTIKFFEIIGDRW